MKSNHLHSAACCILTKILWQGNKYPNKSITQEPLAYESFHTSLSERSHRQGWVWVQVNGIQINHNNTNSYPSRDGTGDQKTYIFKYLSRHLIRAPLRVKKQSLKFVVKVECLRISGPFILFYDSSTRACQWEQEGTVSSKLLRQRHALTGFGRVEPSHRYMWEKHTSASVFMRPIKTLLCLRLNCHPVWFMCLNSHRIAP